MAKPTINELAAWALKHGKWSKGDIMQTFDMNRFEAHNALNALKNAKIIESIPQLPFQVTGFSFYPSVKQSECDYLGIDVLKVDFTKTNLQELKEEKIEERLPQKSAMGNLAMYRPVTFPVDYDTTRMKCGDLKTGDSLSVISSETFEHPICTNMTRTDGFGYEFKYNHRRDVIETEKGKEYVWVKDESMNGWGVGQINQNTPFQYNDNQVSYAFSFPGTLYGKPVVNADYLFSKTRGDAIITLPDTIQSMKGICSNTLATQTLNWPKDLEDCSEAYENSPRLEIIKPFPEDVTPTNYTNMFVNCHSITKDELSKLPEYMDKSIAVVNCGGKFIDDKGILGDDSAKAITDETPEQSEKVPIADDISR